MLKLLRKNTADYIRANVVAYFFLILIFIIGIVIGAMAVRTLPDEQKAELASYLQYFLQGLAPIPTLSSTITNIRLNKT